MKEQYYLSVNVGSSSLKFTLYRMPEEEQIIDGCVEKVGKEGSYYKLKKNGQKVQISRDTKNFEDATNIMFEEISNTGIDISEIEGIGHRILHGGSLYKESVLIDDEVLNNIKKLKNLGPLHHPNQIETIEHISKVLPYTPQIAVFDTAFHQTIPEENYLYAVPYEWYEKYGVRVYGFHGTSYRYILEKAKQQLNIENPNLIVCHLGSGASVCCIKDGKSFDTSMGLTPNDGIVMGTRSGRIDFSIIEYMMKEKNLTIDEVMKNLYGKSGLLAISGYSSYVDVVREVNAGNKKAILAEKMFENSVRDFISKYLIELQCNVDAVIFTGGIGENGEKLRENAVDGFNCVGLKIDSKANSSIKEGIISLPESRIPVYVIPTDEQLMIARDTRNITESLNKQKQRIKDAN